MKGLTTGQVKSVPTTKDSLGALGKINTSRVMFVLLQQLLTYTKKENEWLSRQQTFLDSKYDVISSLEPFPISHSEPKLVHSFYKVRQPQYSLVVAVVDDILKSNKLQS